MGQPLKLRAEDSADLAVVAACLQDAIVPVAEMAFQAEQRQFLLLASRFCWEVEPGALSAGPTVEAEDQPEVHERVTCAVRVTGVERVQIRGFDLRRRGDMLSLLTLSDDAQGLTLVFAGGAAVRLDGRRWRLWLEDVGESWPTRLRPAHPDPDTPSDPAALSDPAAPSGGTP